MTATSVKMLGKLSVSAARASVTTLEPVIPALTDAIVRLDPAWSPVDSCVWEDLPGLTAELLRRGYTESNLSKIFRENALRVLADAIGS